MKIIHILPLSAMFLCLAALGPHTGQARVESPATGARFKNCYMLNGCKGYTIPGITSLQQCIEADGASWMDEKGECHTDLDTSANTPTNNN